MMDVPAIKDRMIKFNMYERIGVKEYCLISPEDKTIEVFTLNKNQKYSRPEFNTEEYKIQCRIIEGLNIDLSTIFVGFLVSCTFLQKINKRR